MKDKEMIEEIFQDVAKVMCDCEDKERFFRPHRYECRKCYMHTVIQHIVFFLRNSDYQKIDKDSVVLSKEEYEELRQNLDKLRQSERANILANIADGGTSCHWCEEENQKIGYEKGSKETAEKICLRLIEIFSTAKGVCSGCALQHDKNKNPTAREFQFGKYKGFEIAKHEVKELAKQFGVEIKE